MNFLDQSWAVWLIWLLGAFYLVNGALNLVGLQSMRDGFRRWGFPPWFHLFNGALHIAIALALLWPPTRGLGLRLSILLCFAIWITLARHRDFRHLPPSVVLFALTLLAAWGLNLV